MKKATLKTILNKANAGHELKISFYWVRDAFLLRVNDAKGRRVRGGYALLNDDNSDLAADRKAIENLIQFRDQVESKRAMGDLPRRPDIGSPGNEFKMPTFKEPEFQAPNFKAPNFKAPNFQVPDFKKPDLSGLEIDKEIPEADKDLSDIETGDELRESLKSDQEEGRKPRLKIPWQVVWDALVYDDDRDKLIEAEDKKRRKNLKSKKKKGWRED